MKEVLGGEEERATCPPLVIFPGKASSMRNCRAEHFEPKCKKRQRAFVKIDPTLSSLHTLKSQRLAVEICSFTQQTLSTTTCQAVLR